VIKIKRVISELDKKIPKGYAISYLSPRSFTAVCYPIGLHWVMNLLRKFHIWVKVGAIEKSEFIGFAKGFREGRKEGYDVGFKKGEKDGAEESKTELMAIKKAITKIKKVIKKKK